MVLIGSEAAVAERTEIETVSPEAEVIVLTTAELAECTCPDFCERDHDND
jgi:hypothetical protein